VNTPMYTLQPLKKFKPRFISADATEQWQGFEECNNNQTPLYLVPFKSTLKEEEGEEKPKIPKDRMNLLFLCDEEKPKPLNLDFRILSSLPLILPEVRSFPCPSSTVTSKRSFASTGPAKSPKALKKRLLKVSTSPPDALKTDIRTYRFEPSPSPPPQAGASASASASVSVSAEEMLIHVLYAEDSETCRVLVSRTISQLAGVICDTALDGFDCCKKIEENPQQYQLILMDLIMPGLNGINATIRIRNLGYNIPIVAITGVSNITMMKQECDIAGMNGFIQKPLTLQKFKSILSEQKILISGS